MSAVLSAIIKGEDKLSAIFDKIAGSGAAAVAQWQSATSTASEAFAEASGGANVAQKAMDSAAASTEGLSRAVGEMDRTVAGAARETENLGEKTRETSEEFDGLGESGAGMAEQISGALAAAGIITLIANIKGAVIDMAHEFSNAEAIIVRSTGASGAELSALRDNMFNVFATARSGDLSTVAMSISEVNTRLGLQGEELERVTSLFMDYADMNGTNVTSSIQKLSQVMTRWNVDASQTEGLLDKLTFASQTTGLSVDALGYSLLKNQASFDALGFSLDESIALMAALEAGGINSQAAMYGLRRVVTYSAKDGKDAGEAFREIIHEIQGMENQADATARAVEAFGVRAGPEMAVAIRSGKFEIDEWIAKIGSADGTLAATAAAATTLEERWTQASNAIQVAFASQWGPTVAGVSGLLADAAFAAAGFLQESTWAMPVIGGLAAGLGVLSLAVAGYNAKVVIATALTKVWVAAKKLALGPIGWLSAGLAALVAVGTAVASSAARQNEEFNSLTATSKLQYNEVRRLSDEHERAIEVYGRNSYAAQRLAGEVEGARLAFENNRRTIAEVRAEQDRMIDANWRFIDSHHAAIRAIDAENSTAEALIGRLRALDSQTSLTAGEQHELELIVDRLNSQFPELSLAVDGYTNALNKSVDAVDALREAEVERQMREQQWESGINAEIRKRELDAEIAAQKQQVDAARELWHDATLFQIGGNRVTWTGRQYNEFDEERDRLRTLQEQHAHYAAIVRDSTAAMEEYSARAAEAMKADAEKIARAKEEAANAYVLHGDAILTATASIADELVSLIERYNDAHAAALDSVRGQKSLWDEAAEVAEKSVSSVRSSINRQASYWREYNSNLSNLTDRAGDIEGLAELISSFADGSENSVNMIAGMASATDEELAGMIRSWQRLQDEQDAVAHSLAELATDFSSNMDEIEAKMHETVDNLNMREAAAYSARETMSGFIGEIRAMAGEAESAAAAVANAFAGRSTTAQGVLDIFSIDVPGYATGTTNAPNAFIAGEQGPELIVGAGGSTVYTASETRQILAGAGGSGGEKRIVLDITGRGEIEVTGGADAEAVWDYAAPRLKAEFVKMLRDDVFEEGDLAHEF